MTPMVAHPAPRQTMGSRLRFWDVRTVIREPGLALQSRVWSIGEPGVNNGKVIDGLGVFRGEGVQPGAPADQTKPAQWAHAAVTSATLIDCAGLRVREFSVETDTTVRGKEIVESPVIRALPLRHIGAGTRVRSLNTLQAGAAVREFESGSRIPEAAVLDDTRRLRIYPHCRRSLDVSGLDPAVAGSFLREAEITKGIPVQQLELLGVFQNVPTALISKIRFLEKRGVILYTLLASDEQSRTRVHDLAAVRDVGRNTTYLVAHRTRYRTAFLK